MSAIVSIHLTGADDIRNVAREVRKLGDGRVIVNNMAKEMRAAVPPVRKAVKARALLILPHRGKLGKWVASSTIRASVRRSQRNAGVSLVGGRNSAGGRSDLKRIDRGMVRAPAWGNRRHWHLEKVPAGFFTDAVQEHSDEFRDACVRAVDKAVKEVFG